MIVSIQQHGHDWEVWVALADGDPLTQTESFCIGVGATVADAAAVAVQTLHQALDDVVVLAADKGARVARELATPTCAPGCVACADERGGR